VALAVLIGLGGCSEMSRQDQNTAVGAGFGGVAGAVLTDGSAIGTVGGAVVGGVMAMRSTQTVTGTEIETEIEIGTEIETAIRNRDWWQVTCAKAGRRPR